MRPAKGSADSGGLYRKLTSDREMLVAVGERTADPRLERGLIVGDEARDKVVKNDREQ